jgi:hypothetical protein
MGEATMRLEIRSGGDRLRVERLTRELLDHLRSDRAVIDAGFTITAAPPAPPAAGSTGVLDTVVVLLTRCPVRTAGRRRAERSRPALVSPRSTSCRPDQRRRPVGRGRRQPDQSPTRSDRAVRPRRRPRQPSLPDTNQQVTGATEFWHPQVVVADTSAQRPPRPLLRRTPARSAAARPGSPPSDRRR